MRIILLLSFLYGCTTMTYQQRYIFESCMDRAPRSSPKIGEITQKCLEAAKNSE